MSDPRLTIAYVTCRREPKIELFFKTLCDQLPNEFRPRLVIVDFHRDDRKLAPVPKALEERLHSWVWVPPKPSVWQGRHRLTAVDFFSASNARNTALCYAGPGGWIAYVDDLSALRPCWVASAMAAMVPNQVTCGTYEKVANLKINENGNVTYNTIDGGEDFRIRGLRVGVKACKMAGRLLLGCTLVAPINRLFDINGWPEQLCDGMGYEDCITGTVLENHGCSIVFDTELAIVEDEAAHHTEGNTLLRIDPGKSPQDKSHFMWAHANRFVRFRQTFAAYATLESMAMGIQEGKPFPVPTHPKEEWYTKIPLKTFHEYKYEEESPTSGEQPASRPVP